MSKSDLENENGRADPMIEPEIYEFPCSLAQSRFWVLDQITPEDPALNVAVRWRLKGQVDIPALQHALNAVIERHEILRTAYRDVDGEPVQLIMPAASLQLPVIDLTLLAEKVRLEERERISLIEARKPFDLTAVPNLRATLLKVAGDEYIILVTIHHIASDGWSVGIIARDMMEFYEARVRGAAPQLPELPLQYADYAVWQVESAKVDNLTAERAYWTRQLADYKYFELPADKPRRGGAAPAVIAGRQLPRALTDAMTALAAVEGCTFFMVGAAALFSMLHRLSGEEDIAIGTQIAGRDRVELNDVIGPFINTVPLRADLRGKPTFRQFLARMHDVIEGALLNQRMPLEDIVTIVKPVRDPTRNPLFSVNIIGQRSFIPTDARQDVMLIDMPSVSPGALYDLNFFFVERPDGWRMSCEYNANLYEAQTAEGHLARLQALLESFVTNPDQATTAERPVIATAQPVPLAVAEPVARRTDGRVGIEAQLADIWVEVLKVPILNRKDNFFALGGHSLSAFRMLSRVEKVFDRRISFEDLHANPTIGELAQVLAGKSESTELQSGSKNAVIMQPHGSQTPIFAMQDTFIYQELVNRLGEDRPFVAVPLPSFDEHADMSYAELADRAVQAIEEVRPNGPYILIGFCAAARLNIGVARRLVERGHTVELLISLDAWAPGYMARLPRLQRFLASRSYQVHTGLIYLRSLFGGADARRHALRRIRLFADAFFSSLGLKEKPDKAEVARYDGWIQQVSRADEAVPLPIPILAVHNEHMPLGLFLDETMGWQGLTTKGVTMAPIPGTHEELIRRVSSIKIADVITATTRAQAGR